MTCWVNPADPSESVIDRSLPGQALMGLFFATPFVSVGVAGLSTMALPWLRRRFLAARKAQMLQLVGEGRLPAWVMRAFADDDWTGRMRNEKDLALVIAADERLPSVLGVTFINLFWNGIVGVFVLVAIKLWTSGETGEATLLSLFLIPFIAVGVTLFWFALKQWALLRRSGWVAALQPVPDFEGGEARFCWAWLAADAGWRDDASHAKVRIVAQAARWDNETDSPTRRLGRGRKRAAKLAGVTLSKSSSDEVELAAVEIPNLDITGGRDTLVPLPGVPPEAAKKLFGLSSCTWGQWWELELTYGNGEIESSALSVAERIG